MSNVLSSEFWSNLVSVGLGMPTNAQALQRANGGTFGAFNSTSHKLDAEEIDAIKQTQSKGFKVIDIDPNALNKEDFFCVYDESTLARLIGAEFSGWGTPNTQVDTLAPPSANGSPRPYWRTVNIDLPGNFLKIEFLPARTTETREFTLSPDENPISLVPQNTNDIGNTDQYSSSAITAGKRTCLVDFETPTPTPHLARHGTIFKTYFSSFFFTFKQMNVRIRLTIGYNSEIQEETNKESTLALFGGYGLTTDSPTHPITYCLTDRDVNTVGYEGIAFQALPQYANLVFSAYEGPFTENPMGLSLFYITEFSGMSFFLTPSENANAFFVGELELVHVKLDALQVNIDYPIKRLASLTLSASNSQRNMSNVRPSEPIRVSLRPGEALALRYSGSWGTSPTTTTLFKFQIHGYTFGNWSGSDLSGIPRTPFFTELCYREHPFPQDVATRNMPRR